MNNAIFYFFYSFAHRSALFDKGIIFFAVYFPYIVVILAAAYLIFYRKKWKNIIIVFFSGILALVVAEVLKIFIHTSRPFAALSNVHSIFPETGYSFPSAHAVFFSALAVSIFFIDKKVGYIFMFFALLIGLARIMTGVHFPIDILGGFVLGTLMALLVNFYIF